MKRLQPAIVPALLGLCLALSGCELTPRSGPAEIDARGMPHPSYSAIAERYNQRIGRLDKVWARMSMRVIGHDRDGSKVDEQAEGHLQVVRPDKLALSITKVGETYFYLGCNESVYWWLDLRDDKRALLGRHETATPELAARFDIPVHPLDLLELLGVTPLPPGAAARTAWSRDGRDLQVTLPGRWGHRVLSLDPASYQPRRIELLDSRGHRLVSADLEDPQPVVVRCDSATPPMASLYQIYITSSDTRITLRLYDPENRCDRQKLTPFDFAALREAYGITKIERLEDKPAAGRASK